MENERMSRNLGKSGLKIPTIALAVWSTFGTKLNDQVSVLIKCPFSLSRNLSLPREKFCVHSVFTSHSLQTHLFSLSLSNENDKYMYYAYGSEAGLQNVYVMLY